MLTGDLTDFSLREILRFLATTASSGVLELRTTELHAGVALRGGGVCLALLEMSGIRGLAARMVRAGGITVQRLHQLGDASSGDAIDLAAVLATETADRDAAPDVFREHTYETLAWLLRHRDAQFLFEGSTQLDDWPFAAMDVDGVLDTVAERAGDWDDLSDGVADLTRVCSAVPQLPEAQDINLSSEQWRVLALVDGRRRLKDLIELSGVGHLATCRHLDQLSAAGLVELVDPGAPSTVDGLLAGLDALRPGRYTPPAVGTSGLASTSVRAVDGEGAAAPAATEAAAEQAVAEPIVSTAPSGDGDDDPDAAVSDANRALFERLVGGGGNGA